MNMEGESESEAKAPLLVAAATDGRMLSSSSRRLRLSRRNSVNSFRQNFVSRLPDKLRPGLDLESASLIDFSKTTALTQGPAFWRKDEFVLGPCEKHDFDGILLPKQHAT